MKKRSGPAQNVKAVQSNSRSLRFKLRPHGRVDEAIEQVIFQGLYISFLIPYLNKLVQLASGDAGISIAQSLGYISSEEARKRKRPYLSDMKKMGRLRDALAAQIAYLNQRPPTKLVPIHVLESLPGEFEIRHGW